MKIFLLLGVLLPLVLCDSIVINEDDLIGTCTRTCDNMPSVTNKHGCSRINNCRKSSTGWNRGFVRCDYCRCDCQPLVTRKQVHITRTQLSVTEPDLYGTCTKTCDKSGLVRTYFRDCSEVRDCRRERKGWTRGFVRCDYCVCACLTKTYTAKYRLTNVRYDLSRTTEETLATPRRMAYTVMENRGQTEQKSIRTLTYTEERSSSITTTSSFEAGVAITVEAGVSVGVASLSTSVTASLSVGYSYEKGRSETKTEEDSIAVEITVPPRSSREVVLVGFKMKVNIPYTATQVTEYEDGTSSSTRVSGVYTNVEVGKFRVIHEAARPLQ